MRATVITLPVADAQAIEADLGWRERRSTGADVFVREYRDAIALLGTAPLAGVRIPARRRARRRLLLPKSGFHVYYRHFPRKSLVVIEAVWSAVRGRGPHLGPG